VKSVQSSVTRSGERQGLLRGLFGRLAKLWHGLAAWRWGAPLGRAAIAVLGLFVLAWIGRSALAWGARAKEPAAEPGPSDTAMPASTATTTAAANATLTSSSTSTSTGNATSIPNATTASSASTDDGETNDDPEGGPRGAHEARGRATPDDPVYLNRASLTDLRRLPGVGSKRAKAILALREKIQRFRQIEDLLKVKGIGRSALRKLRPLVRLDGPSDGPGGQGDGGATTPPP
jgi:competence protein ComEA